MLFLRVRAPVFPLGRAPTFSMRLKMALVRIAAISCELCSGTWRTVRALARSKTAQLAAGYSAASLFATSVFGWTFLHFPLLPLKLDNIQWLNAWILASAMDYELLALVMGGIVCATEGASGVMWTLGIMLGGPEVACAYIGNRQFSRMSLALKPNFYNSTSTHGFVAHAAGAVRLIVRLWMAMYRPLFPQLGDTLWLKSYLAILVIDYHLLAFCLCAIMLLSESRFHGSLWSIGVNALGSGVALAFAAISLIRRGTLQLAS
jgi:hypothetical protein